MLTATQIIYLAHGNEIEFEESGTCRLCGGRLHNPVPAGLFGSNNWTDEFLCRDLSSTQVCGSCEFVRDRRTEIMKGTRVLVASPSGLFRSDSLGGLLDAAESVEPPSVWIVRGGSSPSETQKHIVFRSLDAVTHSRRYAVITCYGLYVWPLRPMHFTLTVDLKRLADDASLLVEKLKGLSEGVKSVRKVFFREERYRPYWRAFRESPYGVLLGSVVLDRLSAVLGEA